MTAFSIVELKKDEREIKKLCKKHSREQLIAANNRITEVRAYMFLELERLRKQQTLINKSLGYLYEKDCEKNERRSSKQ